MVEDRAERLVSAARNSGTANAHGDLFAADVASPVVALEHLPGQHKLVDDAPLACATHVSVCSKPFPSPLGLVHFTSLWSGTPGVGTAIHRAVAIYAPTFHELAVPSLVPKPDSTILRWHNRGTQAFGVESI